MEGMWTLCGMGEKKEKGGIVHYYIILNFFS